MTERDTYYPKALARFNSRSQDCLSLKTLSEDAALKLFFASKICNGKERDARAKKIFRKYMNLNLPRELQQALIKRCVNRWFGVDRLLKLFELFEPRSVLTPEMDLLGSFRYAYGCYFVQRKLFWSNGTIERLNLNTTQCNRLFQYLQFWSRSPTKYLSLRSLAVSTDRIALCKSNLPSLIARSHNLTNVTILNGATNHVLRLLGLNCPFLTFLDISHSQTVTDSGMFGLFFRRPRSRMMRAEESTDLNECAKSLLRIITIGTSISNAGTDTICRLMNTGYSVSFLPDSLIYRAGSEGELMDCEIIRINTSTRLFSDLEFKNSNLALAVETTIRRFIEVRRGTEHIPQAIDIFGDEQKGQLYVHPVGSFIAQSVIGIQTSQITELILTWDSFTWAVSALPDLTELGVSLPALKVLKARIQGSWDRNEALFPCLEDMYVWTVCDTTLMSFLRWSPKIKSFKCNCLSLISDDILLTDDSLKEALKCNLGLLSNLQEMSIRPATNLTTESVRFLIKFCKKLQRLGDMESWCVSTAHIKRLNAFLDRTNSKCILTVLSFPPKKSPEYLL